MRSEAERRKRVNRIKKIILFTIVLAILVPVILCIILFYRVSRLESKIRQLEAAQEMRLAERGSDDGRLSPGNGKSDYLMQDIAEPDEQKEPDEQTPPAETDAEAGTGDSVTDEPEGETEAGTGADEPDGKTEAGTGADEPDGDEAASGDPDGDMPVQEASAEQRYEGYRKVYLTFDDGPSIYTDNILDILDSYGILGTFFVVGKTDEHSQEMYRRIVEEGHTLGMHSYSHKYHEIYASVDAFTQDLEKLSDYLYDMTGTTCRYYRFPGGSSNTVSKVDIQELIDVLAEREIIYFDWNVVSGDAMNVDFSVDELVNNVIYNLEEYHTAVVLMHDSGDKPLTVTALPIIIERIMAMDHTVILPISEETVRIQHVVPDHER